MSADFTHGEPPAGPTISQAYVSQEAWARACKLIDFFAGYIGKMAPMGYSNLYSDLNEHWLLCQGRGEQNPTVKR